LKGTVKAVPSGDSLLIMGSVRGGPPPEKTITLAALIAPKLARRDGRDEPFAWDSREFLRKKCIGKDVTFKVDYTVPAINREFGMVMLGSENVAFDVVSQGWAKVSIYSPASISMNCHTLKLGSRSQGFSHVDALKSQEHVREVNLVE
jgi:staphylococcal nuclease domain-containing protein 1